MMFCVFGSAAYPPHGDHVSLIEAFVSLRYLNLGGASFFISESPSLSFLDIKNCEKSGDSSHRNQPPISLETRSQWMLKVEEFSWYLNQHQRSLSNRNRD